MMVLERMYELEIDRRTIKIADKLGLNTDSEPVEVEEKVGDYLALYGFDYNDEITEEGLICESIIDIIDDWYNNEVE